MNPREIVFKMLSVSKLKTLLEIAVDPEEIKLIKKVIKDKGDK